MTDIEMSERKRHLLEQFRALQAEDVPGDPGQWNDASAGRDYDNR